MLKSLGNNKSSKGNNIIIIINSCTIAILFYQWLQDETQPRTLVYADLGPLSHGKKKPFTSAVTVLDDDRIEYAQLNIKLSAESQKDMQQISTYPESSSGIIINNNNMYYYYYARSLTCM